MQDFDVVWLDILKEKIIQSNGTLEGSIAREFKGTNGFGYDPIFITENGKHLAELEKDEKKIVSLTDLKLLNRCSTKSLNYLTSLL